jgi:hypothetical protein
LVLAAGPADFDTWKFEVLHRKGGKAFKGLVVEETPAVIKFWEVKRRVGRPTIRLHHTFPVREVERIERLDAQEREILAGRIHALDPDGKAEKLLMENLVLESVPWGKGGAGQGWCYTSVQFVLLSNAREDVVRRAAVRLEQIYAAYARFLPPRHPLTRPTTICLVHSLAEYQETAKNKGHKIFNPAFYDPARNEILCGSEFQRLGEDLEKVRKQHQRLKKQIADLNKRYKGKIPAVIQKQLFQDKVEMARVNEENEKVFNSASQLLFRTLYHEAFHAYLANYVYLPKEAAVPYWLNEGLAQVFETALVEANELRVGHVDRDRLVKVQALARRGDLVAISDLLQAGAKQFHVTHASKHQLADRHYLTSWALAFYLLADRKVLIDSRRLNQYVSALKRGDKPLQAFGNLVGKPLPEFEKGFREYVLRLKPDGSLAKAPTK